jgi:hypothetical protein
MPGESTPSPVPAALVANTAPVVPTKPVLPVKVVNPVPAVPYSPLAHRFPVKLRATALKLVAEFTPQGSPHPEIVAIAKQTAEALINSFPESVTGVEVLLESNAGAARQVNVIVFPHEL